MDLYKLTRREMANEAIKHLYKTHLECIIEMLVDEPDQYNDFKSVDVMLQNQKAQFVEMTLEPLMADIKFALEESLNRLTVQTISIEVDAEGLKDAKFKVNVPDFDDVPF